MANVTQTLTECTLCYDLTGHRITVTDRDGETKLLVWRVPDTPGGYDVADEGSSMEVNNPNGFRFLTAEGS